MGRCGVRVLTFVECTTRGKSKRHLAEADWTQRTLCGHRAWSQEGIDDDMPRGWRKRTVIAELPPCAQCEKSKQRRIDGRPS